METPKKVPPSPSSEAGSPDIFASVKLIGAVNSVHQAVFQSPTAKSARDPELVACEGRFHQLMAELNDIKAKSPNDAAAIKKKEVIGYDVHNHFLPHQHTHQGPCFDRLLQWDNIFTCTVCMRCHTM